VSIDSIAGPVVAIHETVEPIGNGALIFDSSLMSGVSEQTFAAAGWKSVRKIEDVLHSGGRGNTLILGDGRREYVLRHFRRGGLVGRLIRDTYLWLGEDRTRSFAQWRILQKLYNRGLPVPRPAVARYRRYGVFYTADIITVRIPGIRSLSARLAAQPFPARLWQRIGALGELLQNALPASKTPISGVPLGPHRRVDWIEMPLDELTKLRRELGCKLNDLVLTIVAGAVHRYLDRLGVPLSGLDFRISIPVNVRRDSDDPGAGNRVSTWIIPLPLDEPNPLKQLEAIRSRTRALKESNQAIGFEMVMAAA